MSAGGSIVGAWQLVSWEVQTAERERWHPLGNDVTGQLLYAPNGYMSVSMTRARRTPLGLTSDELLAASMDLRRKWRFARTPKLSVAVVRYAAAAFGYVSYAGSYRVQGNTVFHDISVSLVPDMIGTTVERSIDFRGEALVLSADSGAFTHSITWSRLA
jgi:hypothetical protein